MTTEEMKRKKEEPGHTDSQPAMNPDDYYYERDGKRYPYSYPGEENPYRDASMLREGGAWYEYGNLSEKKVQGRYTVEDIDGLPENVRVELIDGVLYDMAAPTLIHQGIAGYLHAKFLEFIGQRGGGCYPFLAPTAVQLDRDNKTRLEPDVLIVCRKEDDDLVRKRVIYGAPDFVLEVLSPSSVRKDSILKAKKYLEAGVREFWLIDPEKKVLYVHDFEHGNIVYLYSFEDKVPVRIWDGQCEIDLAKMYASIQWLYEKE